MSDSEKQRKSQLECLRLASELEQLARETSDPNVKANFLRGAEMWAHRANEEWPDVDVIKDISID